MIDLESPELPRFLVVGGEPYEVDTSFRTWLRWGRMLRERHVASWSILSHGAKPPGGGWVGAAVEFYNSDPVTPRGARRSGARTMDLALDGDYVVGSFQSAYGIDLTTGDMHWHRFLALLRSLPRDAKLPEIAGYRAWQQDKRGHEAVMRELRREWALPAGSGGDVDVEQYEANIAAHAEKLGLSRWALAKSE